MYTRGSYKDRRHTERVYKIRGAANISYIVHWMTPFGFHVIPELLDTQEESAKALYDEHRGHPGGGTETMPELGEHGNRKKMNTEQEKTRKNPKTG